MKLRNYALALIVLLGCAYAKDKSMADYPNMVTIKSNSDYEGTALYINGEPVSTTKCSMIIYDDTTIYTVGSSGSACKAFHVGSAYHVRFYSGAMGQTAEFAWLHNGKVKTAKYKVDSQSMR
jgi:hypothetical protein